MPDIKTKNVVKGTVKTIHKSAVAAERMKDAYIRTKDKAEHGVYSAEGSAEEYAADRISGCADTVTREAVRQFDKQGRRGVQSTKNNISKAKEHFRQRQAQKSIKTLERGEKTIKQTAKSTGKSTIKTAKGSVKTAQKTVKTAEQTARTAIKTSEQAAKVAQKTAQASAKAARTAAQAAKATAKATVATIKAAAKATVAAVKAIIAGTKALISAIAAGGWVAVVIIIVVCLIALIVGSCFGIFFSGEDSGSSMTMQSVVQEINTDYQTQLDTTKTNISYDVLEMSGSRAVWPEVLAVYAVKTTTDPNNPQDVATMDASKKAILIPYPHEPKQRPRKLSPKRMTVTAILLKRKRRSHGLICIYRWLIRPPEKWQINSDSMQISASSLRNFLPKKTAVCGARFFMAFTPRTDKLFPLLSRRLAMWAVSRIGVGMALTAVWNGAPVLFRGRRMSAGILIVVLSRNLQAAQTACNGLRIEVNGLTTAPRRRRV